MNPAQALPLDTAPSRSSIVAHPWFPKMIGLWCAALFGLCSLAVAPEVLERVVATLGIDRIVAAAAPPLGQTARLLLALSMSAVGEIIGLVIGRSVAASRVSRSVRQARLKAHGTTIVQSEDLPNLRGRDRHPDAPARKPLSASSDLRDETVASATGIDATLQSPALTGDANGEAHTLVEFASMPAGNFWHLAEIDGGEDRLPGQAETEDLLIAAQTVQVDAFGPGQSDARFQTTAEARDDHEPEILAPRFPSSVAPPPAPIAPIAPIAAITTASLEQLGVVQLSERLALALQARRERSAPAPGAPLPIDAPSEASAPAGLEILARRAPKPGSCYDARADDAEAIRADGVSDAEIEDSEESSDENLEAGYSSLLAMGSGFQHAPAGRIEQPHSNEVEPVVIFPGQGARSAGEVAQSANFSSNAPYARPTLAQTGVETPVTAEPGNQTNPDDTDRALRAALASLQRISAAR